MERNVALTFVSVSDVLHIFYRFCTIQYTYTLHDSFRVQMFLYSCTCTYKKYKFERSLTRGLFIFYDVIFLGVEKGLKFKNIVLFQ